MHISLVLMMLDTFLYDYMHIFFGEKTIQIYFF
jgi:hypothetical protein